MKITCSKRDEILERKAAYEAQKDENLRQRNAYNAAMHDVYHNVEKVVLDAIGPSTEELSVHATYGLGRNMDSISCTIKGNDANIFDKSKALSWSYSVSLDNDGKPVAESSSWSGLNATTPEQISSLKETLRILEIINGLDWASILSVGIPDYKSIVTTPAPDSRLNFDRELLELDVEELVGTKQLVKCTDGKLYNGTVYVGIISETPTMYNIFEVPGRYINPDTDGKYSWGNQKYSSMEELIEEHCMTSRVKKDKFMSMLATPLDIISY